MNSLRFGIPKVTRKRLYLTVYTNNVPEQLWFELPSPRLISNDVLANSLTTLAGKKFRVIVFDFPISKRTLTDIAQWTGSEVIAPISSETNRGLSFEKDSASSVLNFSGGYDSMAARLLLPKSSPLVSLDFGGRFSRERRHFKKFDTTVVKTNLINTSLKRNSWSFMGLGALLLTERLPSGFCSFGSIYEASGFQRSRLNSESPTYPPFKLAGYRNAAVVSGITEVGTTLILLKTNPEVIEDSLRSLASPGEEKYFRKVMMTRVLADELDMYLKLPKLSSKQRIHYKFGENFATDVTAMFFLSRGFDDAAEKLVAGMPNSIKEYAKSSDMKFMYKANPDCYLSYPAGIRNSLEDGLSLAKIDWYTEKDFRDLEEFRSILSGYYKFD